MTNINVLTENWTFFQISAKSWFRSIMRVWWAAKWEHTKHKEEAWRRKWMATAPLLPAFPDMPVFTVLTATSLDGVRHNS